MPDDEKPSAKPHAIQQIRFSRTRTLDHEVKRLPNSILEKRRAKRQQTINEELLARQTKASERGARWTLWAVVIAVLAIAVAVIKSALE